MKHTALRLVKMVTDTADIGWNPLRKFIRFHAGNSEATLQKRTWKILWWVKSAKKKNAVRFFFFHYLTSCKGDNIYFSKSDATQAVTLDCLQFQFNHELTASCSVDQMNWSLMLIQYVKAWWFATNNREGIAEICLLVCRCLDYWAIRLIEISFTMLLIDPEYPHAQIIST